MVKIHLQQDAKLLKRNRYQDRWTHLQMMEVMAELSATRRLLQYKGSMSMLVEGHPLNKEGAVLPKVRRKDKNAMLLHQLQVCEDQVNIIVD